MYCPQCGATNQGEADACSSCGFDLNKYQEQWQEDPQAGQGPAAAGSTPGVGENQSPQSGAGGSQAPGYRAGQYQSPGYQGGPYQAPPYQQIPQAGAYQGPPYAPYGPRGPYGQLARIPSYLGWAIAVLILCFWPTGIVAVVYASQVDNKLVMGDVTGAQYSSRKAKLWCWITFGIGIAGIVIAIIGIIIAIAFASSVHGVVY